MDRLAALQLFTRLVERGSFSAAARELGIKQSTASKWIAELESQFGVSLVQRTTRSVHVTEAGQQLLDGARQIVAAYDELQSQLEERAPEPKGRIRISVPVVFGRLFVVPAAATFVRRHAQVEVALVFNDRYVNLVEEGFDLAIRVGIPTDTSARGRKLADSRRVLVAAPKYLKKHGTPERPKDLQQHECLFHVDASSQMIWRFAKGAQAEIPVAVRGRLAANNSEAVLALARDGLGIALLADWLVGDDLRSGKLVPLLESFSTPPAPIYALSPAGRFTATAVRAMIDHLVAAMAERLPARA
ncbi:MAG TPA: LysR family transcriptional regulator [Polyangiaceae bacterium]|nr:LysR family transcriptional regulator [Polyangiaceae bacterium]